MIEILEQYDINDYIFSHDPLCECTKTGMNDFWTILKSLGQLTQRNSTIEDIVVKFTEQYNRNPNNDEIFILKCFINGNTETKD